MQSCVRPSAPEPEDHLVDGTVRFECDRKVEPDREVVHGGDLLTFRAVEAWLPRDEFDVEKPDIVHKGR